MNRSKVRCHSSDWSRICHQGRVEGPCKTDRSFLIANWYHGAFSQLLGAVSATMASWAFVNLQAYSSAAQTSKQVGCAVATREGQYPCTKLVHVALVVHPGQTYSLQFPVSAMSGEPFCGYPRAILCTGICCANHNTSPPSFRGLHSRSEMRHE